MSDYLVTGANGYVGSKIIEYLENKQIEYVGIDKHGDKSTKVHQFNLNNKNKLFAILRQTDPKIIIHCGTYSAIPYRDNFLESFKEDSLSLSNILDFLKIYPHIRLIFFSSSYVYSGISSQEICTEELPLSPTHNFGIAKLFFEKLIISCHPNSIVFRLSSVFGSGNQLQPNAIKNMIKQGLNNKVLDIWGEGKRKMQYIYINDVIESIITSKLFSPGIYNLGGSDYISVSDTAKIIANKTFSKMNFIKDKKEGYTLPFMSIAKLKKENSGKCPREIKSTLIEYINYFGI